MDEKKTKTSSEEFITPYWVFQRPRPTDRHVRYTPRNLPFRDADWVEPRGWVDDLEKDKTYSFCFGGAWTEFNSTPASWFECDLYIKWVPNPTPPTLLQRLFKFKWRYPYWIPYNSPNKN